ncbi:hypothetical protein ABT115_13590 [Streptomyces sp. NPDC001832]|uniref:hypothetical protein n=1 Tax=Streptomyces sp. NPDC001832 TaxID=3154527 RepID=UPI003317BF2C
MSRSPATQVGVFVDIDGKKALRERLARCSRAPGTQPSQAVASVTALGQRLAAAEMAGILVISAGLAGLAFTDG